ncbi:transporter substrate-binding domain-containing protein [Pseudoalteromonas sp. C2R02]|uniref:substrate-binding periplasmic protein n=1 Tax=Pseudoalteromonas sp. C2R02 TaxID=2841565 RepID=UPI001C09DA2A|nr:transporter substrate-binding domain-containing protein [Pseudoalteromonas sp. C2R02]MBU2967790.1 transporter substrate-binding domain-containing protein [Pseudoalteromonas sp. C2R02]
MVRQIILLITTFTVCDVFSCNMVMGYRENERQPFINRAPQHDGLYIDLYKQALKEINCTLSVVRAPKKRILNMLKKGQIDFYPGLSFNKQRSAYVHFIKNGLKDELIAISKKSLSKYNTRLNLKFNLESYTFLMAQGANTLGIEHSGARIRYVENLSIANAVKFISENKADYYIYHKASLLYYLNTNHITHLEIHACCGEPKPMYLGFSKRSIYAEKTLNTSFNNHIALSPNNTPYNLKKQSKAFQLATSLQRLKQLGYIKHLEELYFHP